MARNSGSSSRSDDRRISEGVFDNSTLMTLYDMVKRRHLSEMIGLVSTGKEANIYHGLAGRKEIALKIYCVEACDFNTMGRYVKGDTRFPSWRNKRQLIYTWAKKEYHNLMKVHGRVRCPKPIAVLNNVLVMEFIGKKGVGARRLKDSPPEDPEGYFDTIRDYVREMYRRGFVHGDLSEYNILDWNGPVLIDFSQGVLLEHPMAQELLTRDVRNILNYFRKLGVKETKEDFMDYVRKAEVENDK